MICIARFIHITRLKCWLLWGGLILLSTAIPLFAEQGYTPERRMADRLGELARISLANQSNPHPAILTRAIILLEEATRLDPKNIELWRMKIQAIELTNDESLLREALKRYIPLDPRDDAAQLQFVMLTAAQRSTVEEQIAYLRSLVSRVDEGRLSRPMLSRLAHRAAILEYEQSNTEAYVSLLKEAMRLDPANKAAATEAFEMIRRKKGSKIEQLQALLNIFAADPTDISIQFSIASFLAEQGLYEAAMPWYRITGRTMLMEGQATPARLASELAISLWCTGQQNEAAALLESMQDQVNQTRAQLIGRADPRAEQTPELPELPAELQMLRAVIHELRNDQSAAAQSYEILNRQLSTNNDQPTTPEDLLDLVTIRLLLNRDADQIPTVLEQAEAMEGADQDAVQVLKGWLALGASENEQARQKLQPYAQRSALASLGLARLPDIRSDKTKLKNQLMQAWRSDPLSLAGMIAFQQLTTMEATITYDDEAKQMASLADEVPEVVREAVINPLDFLSIRAIPVERRRHYGEPMLVRLQIRNISKIPMEIGQDAMLPSMVAVLNDVTAREFRRDITPLFIEIKRRLTLQPGESLNILFRADSGLLGVLLEQRPANAFFINSYVLLNPKLIQGRQWAPGPMGLTVTLPEMIRTRTEVNEANMTDRLKAIGSDDRDQSMISIAMVLPIAREMGDLFPNIAEQVIRTIVSQYNSLSTLEQAWLLSHMPESLWRIPLMRPVRDMAGRSEDRLVQLMLLSNLVSSANDPILSTYQASEDDIVVRFATATQALMREVERRRAAQAEQEELPATP